MFDGHDTGHIEITWRRFFGFLDTDGIHWDCANIQNNTRLVDLEDRWLSHKELDERQGLDHEIHEYRYNELPEDQRATFVVSRFFKYDDAKPTAKPQKYRLEIPPIAVPLPAG